MADDLAVSVRGLGKRYRTHWAVQDLDLDVAAGESVGIIGPNGAGKTTFVECLAGLRRRSAGSVEIFGNDPETQVSQVRRDLGFQMQHTGLPYNMPVRHAVELFGSFHADPHPAAEIIASMGLTEVESAPWDHLSGGQKQRVAAALALVGRPRLAILDEWSAGLDPRARAYVWEFLGASVARGMTLVVISHNMEEIERLCRRVLLLRDGSIALDSTPAKLRGRSTDRRTITVWTSAALDVGRLRDELCLEDVHRVEEGEHGYRMIGTSSTSGELLAHLAAQQVEVVDLSVEKPSLADVYVDVVRDNESESDER